VLFIPIAALATFILVFALVVLLLTKHLGRMRHLRQEWKEEVEAKALTPREIDAQAKAIIAGHKTTEYDRFDRQLLDSIERTRRERSIHE
jgi:hypothetical protein